MTPTPIDRDTELREQVKEERVKFNIQLINYFAEYQQTQSMETLEKVFDLIESRSRQDQRALLERLRMRMKQYGYGDVDSAEVRIMIGDEMDLLADQPPEEKHDLA